MLLKLSNQISLPVVK